MGEVIHMSEEEPNGAAQHLYEALETEDTSEVNFHIRQALQLLGIRESNE